MMERKRERTKNVMKGRNKIGGRMKRRNEGTREP
jgi:hypothetical protein